ncbi:antibiotic biosynthesis monooxygenase [Ralstonia pseudosolanacearum]|uniref:Antibiotic biosynthesis monooxygenase n=1 Tax=Ralstonia solanacearum TaxID=305 RepID=A0A0S4WQT3_RALSL|nr:antibiotic biosynthesis monooxygenase [Ralstonia solanacearum]UZF13399.1 antibiotic biosynthesis monooxygenase [Ralstonia solanacearum]CUV53493.1 conserved protein of unknown function [Ralstonia solanacearum]
MHAIRPMDPNFPIQRQVELDASPVVLVNLLLLDKADEEAFLRVWQDDANFMKRQPGFISTQLHRAVGDSPAYLNYAVWESNAHFRAAFMHPEFRAKLSDYPSSAVASPHLFGAALPDFHAFAPRVLHGIGARLLLLMALVHAGAALYHHFIRRDGLLRRMWFGK